MSKLWITVRKARLLASAEACEGQEVFWDFVPVDQHCTAIIGEFRAGKATPQLPTLGQQGQSILLPLSQSLFKVGFLARCCNSIVIECSTTELKKCPLNAPY